MKSSLCRAETVRRVASRRSQRLPQPHSFGCLDFSLFGPLLASGPLRSFLKGLLARNYAESQAMLDYLTPSAVDAPRYDWSRFFDELCEFQAADPEDAWDRDERYCVDCIYHLARERVYLWWLAKKRESTSSMSLSHPTGRPLTLPHHSLTSSLSRLLHPSLATNSGPDHQRRLLVRLLLSHPAAQERARRQTECACIPDFSCFRVFLRTVLTANCCVGVVLAQHLCEPTRGDGYVPRGAKAGAGATTATTGPKPATS